jgi:hypothetical protein
MTRFDLFQICLETGQPASPETTTETILQFTITPPLGLDCAITKIQQ